MYIRELKYPRKKPLTQYLRFHVQGQTYQFKALPFGLATAPLEFTVVVKEVKLMALHKGIRIHQYLDDWLVRATVRPPVGSGPTHTRTLAKPPENTGAVIPSDLSGPGSHVFNRFANSHRETSPPRSSPHEANPMAFEKQLESTGILREGHSSSQVLAPTLTMVTGRKECPHRPTTTPSKTCSANFYRRIKRRVGRSLKRAYCKRNLVVTRKQAAYKLPRTQSSSSSLKRVPTSLLRQQRSDSHRQHYSSVIHKQRRRHEVGHALCPSVEDLDLDRCTRNQVTLKARHIPGRLNVVADKLSRLGQTIQTEWSLLPEVFQAICTRWHRPQIDLFATRFNNKLPQFVSPVPDPMATAVDSLSLPWEDLDAYAFPPAAILGKVVEKLQDSPCKRIILIAPGWPNMPWFWDLVAMSSQIPLSLPFLPNLLTQPFNQVPHRNLSHLNLHVWLLEPQQSKNRASLRQWQQELRLLKGSQPDQSMKQSGPFLQNGVSLIRWTSGHPL